ncbi:hypothetical protein CIB48_g5430 [Xylaria polymorpha]|nr:hypothetical protein CIB48_g5430 [Xylaria polymorpha]
MPSLLQSLNCIPAKPLTAAEQAKKEAKKEEKEQAKQAKKEEKQKQKQAEKEEAERRRSVAARRRSDRMDAMENH